METTIRPLQEPDIPAASKLVQRVFDQFEGPDYPIEGIDTFHRFTTPEAMTARLHGGEMQAWGTFRDGQLAGVLASRDTSHISLLFVEEAYHRRGIARALFDYFRNTCLADSSIRRITVNSSPFATEIYRRLGFTPTDTERMENGIRFTPMEYLL